MNNKMKQKIIVLSLLIIILLITWNKGEAMAERSLDYNSYKEKLKEVNISDGVSEEEAIILAQNYIVNDEELKTMCLVHKPKIDERRLSEGYWRIQFPLRWKYGVGWLRRWVIFYVNIRTGEVKEGGQTPDL